MALPKPTAVMSFREGSQWVVQAFYPSREEADEAHAAISVGNEEATAEGAGECDEIARIVEPSAFLEETADHNRVYRNLSLKDARAEALTKAELILSLRNRTSDPEAGAVAWARRWYIDGEVPKKERKENGRMAWPKKFTFHEVTKVKCLHDDVALHPAPATADKLQWTGPGEERHVFAEGQGTWNEGNCKICGHTEEAHKA